MISVSIRDRTIPKVARRIRLPEWHLRRAAKHGDVKVERWAGVEWITPAEEERLKALLAEARAPIAAE
jgi:hypothetical protein